MLSALGIKLDDAKTKLESMSNKFSNEYKELEKIIKSVDKFLNKTGKTEKDWIDIIRLLIDYSDDEFSYDFYKIDKEKIYLTNVPRTLEQRYGESTRKTISLLKFEESYKGFNIYSDKSGNYYFDRHILTTKSYGRKYPNRDACKEVIDNHIKYSPIYKDSLIEFKFLHNRE
jgi:hypothetical protein